MSEIQPSVSYSFTMRLYIENKPGMLARVLKCHSRTERVIRVL